MKDTNEFDKEQANGYAKRHVFMLTFALAFVAFIFTIGDEAIELADVIDDYIIFLVAIIALAIIIFRWRKTSAADLKSTNRILTYLAIVGILSALLGFSQEFNDPAHLANDPAQLVVSVLLVVNGFF